MENLCANKKSLNSEVVSLENGSDSSVVLDSLEKADVEETQFLFAPEHKLSFDYYKSISSNWSYSSNNNYNFHPTNPFWPIESNNVSSSPSTSVNYFSNETKLHESETTLSGGAEALNLDTNEINGKSKRVNDALAAKDHPKVHEEYSSKVFVKNLPSDISEHEILMGFKSFGALSVTWTLPYKTTNGSFKKGNVLISLNSSENAKKLVNSCEIKTINFFFNVPSHCEQIVEILPWRISDSKYYASPREKISLRKTIFLYRMTKAVKAVELANIMNRLYGNVCYVGIDCDSQNYPKGSARVAFSTQDSYVLSLAQRVIKFEHENVTKQFEVVPYLVKQPCEVCKGLNNPFMFKTIFCANKSCIKYYCKICWRIVHSKVEFAHHKPEKRKKKEQLYYLPNYQQFSP